MPDKTSVLDGGLATDLEAAGFKLEGDPLWSARILYTHPQAIKEVHHRFLQSGADIITTATYQASIEGFVKYQGLSLEQAKTIMMSAVQIAKDAIQDFLPFCQKSGRMKPLVAGSVGPYGAFLHDGSEFTGAYEEQISQEEFKNWHRQQIQCLVSAGVDLLAMETIPSQKEAEALVDLLKEFPDTRAWLSYSCKDEQCISHGERFADAVKVASRSKQLIAIGLNCCSPASVSPLLASAVKPPDLVWIVYPNSGEEWDVDSGWKSEKRPHSIADLSLEWEKQGAGLIGGCCRITPLDIAELRQRIHQRHS
ncbi:uncharacterized protein zgc:172121 isoform X1 [Erpetoichthys calabaricus]|uniref:Zgc:172121 n=1 Tax=Erpetoichthys calabaricus TaxID=27687 RepID=A0A8C4X384_ERPCA|nr:uncharacterized protein zgc:172121 isoform X1 [Erpetoichthys calabaricus]XP_028655880.1 uncharacterized protein zgc:172121 isoform X1 [Erpetoichthys calabaricus]